MMSWAPLLAIAASALAAPLIYATGRRPNLREGVTVLAGLAKLALVASMLPPVLRGETPRLELLALADGVSLALEVDAFGLFFALIASGLWVVTSFYSIGYMRTLREHAQTRYYAFFALCVSATIGVAFAANLLTFFVFYEILTVCTYPLVIHEETPEALRSGRKYLLYTLSAGLALLLALILVYSVTGSLDFEAGGMLAGHGASPGLLRSIFVLFMLGVGVKAGIMPLHGWLPSAMVAPTPVSALLHAVAVVKSGVFAASRVLWFVFGSELLHDLGVALPLAALATATILLGSLIALAQDELKRMLAFSTISQLSYIVLGAALLTEASMLGALLHIVNHAFMKITLFFAAGAIIAHTHRKRISQLDGIGRRMPFTMGAFAIGALGMVGLPPVAGFFSKWFLCLGTLEAGQRIFLYALLASSVLNAAYFFPVVFRAFFRAPNPEIEEPAGEASPFMVVPICIAAGLSMLMFLAPELLPFAELARSVVDAVLAGGAP
jgi:multicomponent Na+:H+ antiporter subunit D